MPKALKVVLWVLVFAAAVGAGAYQASKSNPFPPGVEDPGARPTASAHRTPPPQDDASAAHLEMQITSEHVLHVGGSCESHWDVTGTVSIAESGRATGDAKATLTERAACDFSQAQVQTKAIELLVSGKTVRGRLRLSLAEAGRSPAGSQDLGGLPNTLALIHPELDPAGGSATVVVTRPDGDLGRYSSRAHARLSLQ
jgi:hypothetical protein